MKKAIVIGASSGIGKGLAKILAKNNYLVGITGRRTELLNDLKSTTPSSYVVKTLDITDTKLTLAVLDKLVTEMGGLDLLIINSGTGDVNEMLDFEIEKQTINTNILGFTAIADWGFNFFVKQEFGHMVAISSIAGLRGNAHAPAYNASKAYQINYLEGLLQKATHTQFPIYITDIRPGFVDTDMAKGDGLFWVMSVEKTANQIFKAIMKHKKVAYVTKRWGWMALIYRIIPKSIFIRM